MFIKYEAEVSSRVSGVERGVVDFGRLFAETNEEKFSLGGVEICSDIHNSTVVGLFMTPETMAADSVESWLSAHCS